MDRALAKNRLAFEEWLQGRDRDSSDRYWAQGVVVKHAVLVAKSMADRQYAE